MSKKANPAAIGVFVIVALVIAAISIVVLGSGKMFKQTKQFVLFFESSLSGLDVGAPVEYRGVRIGSVVDIHLEYNSDNGGIQSPVTIELEHDRMMYTGDDEDTKGLAFHIQRGLRGQLQAQSIVTGKLKVMLVDRPDTEIRMVGKKDAPLREIPTIPTLCESLQKSIEDMPIASIMTNINATMKNVAAFTESGDLKKTADNLNDVLAQLSMLTSNLNVSIDPLLTSVKRNSDEFLKTQQEASKAIREIQALLADKSPMRFQTQQAMEQLTLAAQSLRELLDLLQQHPESLLTGKSSLEE